MGICYNLIMCDEWNWGDFYDPAAKDKKLKEFESKYDGYIERIAEWSNYVVYDLEKSSPYGDRAKLIREYCDQAYYMTDLNVGIERLDLPPNQATLKLQEMENRRTPEEKKASEELIKEKLKRMWIDV